MHYSETYNINLGARYYNPDISIWLSACPPKLHLRWIDPLSDKYPSLSPYNYCANNPIKYVDPDGREVKISGEEDAKSQYFNELKIGAHELGIKVKMNKNGILSAKYKGKGPISEDGQKLLNAINDKNIFVNINSTNSNYLDDGAIFFGGANLGNNVKMTKIGKDDYIPSGSVTANQTVNPGDLKQIDDYYKRPGRSSLHELSEAYEGALIAKKSGVSQGRAIKGTPAFEAYEKAHNAAISQSGPITRYPLDRNSIVVKYDDPRVVAFEYAIPSPSTKSLKTIPVKR